MRGGRLAAQPAGSLCPFALSLALQRTTHSLLFCHRLAHTCASSLTLYLFCPLYLLTFVHATLVDAATHALPAWSREAAASLFH